VGGRTSQTLEKKNPKASKIKARVGVANKKRTDIRTLELHRLRRGKWVYKGWRSYPEEKKVHTIRWVL